MNNRYRCLWRHKRKCCIIMYDLPNSTIFVAMWNTFFCYFSYFTIKGYRIWHVAVYLSGYNIAPTCILTRFTCIIRTFLSKEYTYPKTPVIRPFKATYFTLNTEQGWRYNRYNPFEGLPVPLKSHIDGCRTKATPFFQMKSSASGDFIRKVLFSEIGMVLYRIQGHGLTTGVLG